MAYHVSSKGYKSDPGVGYWTAVINYPWRNEEMFLGYGGDKEFVVKSYVDASLTPIRIALSRDTGYV